MEVSREPSTKSSSVCLLGSASYPVIYSWSWTQTRCATNSLSPGNSGLAFLKLQALLQAAAGNNIVVIIFLTLWGRGGAGLVPKNMSGTCVLSHVDTVTRRKSSREQSGQTHLVHDTSFRIALASVGCLC